MTNDPTRPLLLHLERIVQEAERSFGHGQTVVLYTSDRSDAVLRAGVGQAEWSREIAAALGEAASAIAHRAFVTGLVLTGGDTAKQVILQLGCTELELLDELETGVPIGRIRPDYAHDEAVYTVTKAGGFGSDKIFVMALEMLGGGFEG